MCRSFAPALIARGGAIVNICSIIGLVNLPPAGTYCTSKAAVHSLLQGVLAELAPKGVRVIGVYPGPGDTSTTAGQKMPKATPVQVAKAILDGIDNGDEEISPEPMSRQVYAALRDARSRSKRSLPTRLRHETNGPSRARGNMPAMTETIRTPFRAKRRPKNRHSPPSTLKHES